MTTAQARRARKYAEDIRHDRIRLFYTLVDLMSVKSYVAVPPRVHRIEIEKRVYAPARRMAERYLREELGL